MVSVEIIGCTGIVGFVDFSSSGWNCSGVVPETVTGAGVAGVTGTDCGTGFISSAIIVCIGDATPPTRVKLSVLVTNGVSSLVISNPADSMTPVGVVTTFGPPFTI